MKHVTLMAVTDEFDSEPGFAVRGVDTTSPGYMADRDGTLTAHDILEHQNGVEKIGPVWDELEAMGGAWYVRGQHGDMLQRRPNIHSPAKNIAADISRMFFEQTEDEWVPREHRYHHTKPSIIDDDIEEILQIARQEIVSEAPHHEASIAKLDDYLKEAKNRMRIGYSKAHIRFRDPLKPHDQFRAIRDQVGAMVRWIEYPGQEFILSWGGGRALGKERYEPMYG